MTQHCPSCGDKICSPHGYGDILLIGEYPGKLEMQQGRPFAVSKWSPSAGRIIRKELSLLGVDLLQLRVCNLWLHPMNKDDNCLKAGEDVCLDEAKGKDAILLVGSESVSHFTGYNVMDVNGLQVESPMLSAPIIYASVNPALAFHRGLGEVRFALTRFIKRLEKEKLL